MSGAPRTQAAFLRAAATSAATTSALIVLMDWVPTPLNRNIVATSVRARLPGSLVHATTGLLLAAGALRVRRPRPATALALAGAGWYSVVATSAALNWWVPYLAGRHPGEIDSSAFAQEYADNVSVLPPIGDHVVVPDVQHMLIHAAVAVSAVLWWRAFAATRHSRQARRS